MIIHGIDITSIITPIIEVLIGLLCTIITTKLIPWLKSKFDENQINFIKTVVKVGVTGAEQLLGSNKGQEKFNFAKDVVVKALEEKGITLDEDVIKGYIESAVHELNQSFKEE